ncbi:MAG: hypothetical protein KDE56_24070, partial [Anaerolineales bacterium]|nr:hypothetical protein [Anaerolineales bacterium]
MENKEQRVNEVEDITAVAANGEEMRRYKKNGSLTKQFYESELVRLQEELVKLQYWVREKGLKVLIIFEGRGSAGKGGVIKLLTERTSPRIVRTVALPV